ncbi:MAG: GTPase [Planctomycetota bacterium]
MQTADTIVAVSSPPGRGTRGLVRWSGDDAADLLERLVGPPPDGGWPTHQLLPRRLSHPDLPAVPAVAALFRGPRSYTGQDVAELQLPGHPALLDRVVRVAVRAGARPAEPGEFTFRAYVNGRMDLTRAEGVAATIHAVSDGQLAAAAHLRRGELARFAAGLVESLAALLALVESGIDFVDQEDVVPIAPADLAAGLDRLVEELNALRRRSRSWGGLDALPRVVLAGPPSAGKSTLFNALLGRPRAVTDAAPGTTRDVIEEPLVIPSPDGTPAEVMLVDLAGLDTPAATLDREAQQHARQAIATADLVLAVDLPANAINHPGPVLPVVTKADLTGGRGSRRADELSATSGSAEASPSQPDPETVHVSGLTGEGLDVLRAAIGDRLHERAVSVHAETLALQPRHESALNNTAAALSRGREHVDVRAKTLDEAEWVAGELRDALNHLAGLGGAMTPDDILGRVFATFCVGK